MTTTTVPEATDHRRATAGLVGGALWALLPLAWATVLADDVGSGSLAVLAGAAAHWAFLVLPPVLILAGLVALRQALDGAGRAGAAGTTLTGTGLAAMAVGNGIEVASLTAGGGEVALGHVTFLLGFLVSTIGGVLLGVVVARRRSDRLSRAGGLLLALALPLGLGIGALGSVVGPGDDAWFWAAISVPAGLAWMLLGRSLQAAPPASREPATAS